MSPRSSMGMALDEREGRTVEITALKRQGGRR